MAATRKKQTKKKTSSARGSKKKKITGAKKGKQFEREVANELRHIFPECQRMMEYQVGDVIGVDLEATDRFLFQCKNYQGYAPIGKIKEIRKQDMNDVPVLVTKGNKLPTMAVLPFDSFVEILEVLYGLTDWEVSPRTKKLQISQAHTIEHNEDIIEVLPPESDPYKPISLSDFI